MAEQVPRLDVDSSGEAPPGGAGELGPAGDAWSTDVCVARWQAGEGVAFRALHARYRPLLEVRVRRSRVWPLLSGRIEVEDVTQEVWTRVISSSRGAFTPSGPGSFLGFLGRLADRTMIDLARMLLAVKRGNGREGSLRTDSERHAVPRPGLPGPGTPTGVARRTEIEAIAGEVLSAREYQAWDLVDLQEYSAEEAGLAMRCSGSAVRGLLLRGRAKLIARLGTAPDA